MATENLKVKITADASQAKAEIGKFKDSLKGAVNEGEAATTSIGKMTAALGGMLATLKVVKALIKNGIDIAAQGDAIRDNAQKVFMNTTAYQEWGYVLKQNGIEMNALKTAMRQFAPQVAAGSDALRKYGITTTDVDTAFQQAIYTIQNMSSETERIAAATELFGSRALELFPILNLTNAETQNLMASYRALGGTMSNELIAASDVCTDSITAMKAAWGGLRNVLAQYFLPIITKVVRWITIAIAYIRILLSAIFGLKSSFGGGGGSKKNALPATTASVAKNTGGAAKNLKKASKHAKELKRTMMGIDELSRLAEKATAAAASGGSGGGGGGVGGAGIGDVGVGDVGTFNDIIDDETLKKIQTFQEKINGIKDTLNGIYLILKGLVEISLGNLSQGWEDIKSGVEKVFPQIKDLKDKWAEMKATIEAKIAAAKVVLEDKFSSVWETVKTKWAEVTNTIGGKVQTAKAVLEDKFSEAWTSIKAVWDTVKTTIGDKTQTAKAILEDKFSSAWKNIKDVWDKVKDVKGKYTATLTLNLKNNFSKKWKKVKKAWNGIKSKTATIKLSFKNAITKGWNAIADKVNAARNKSSLVKTLFPNALPKLAKGGILTTPTAAIIGEYAGARNNPEIATPQSLMAETMRDVNGDLVSAFAQMTRQVIAAIEDKDLSVKIGDESIARSAQRGNAAYKNRTGRSLITI